jgi:hypothetical protein
LTMDLSNALGSGGRTAGSLITLHEAGDPVRASTTPARAGFPVTPSGFASISRRAGAAFGANINELSARRIRRRRRCSTCCARTGRIDLRPPPRTSTASRRRAPGAIDLEEGREAGLGSPSSWCSG